MQRGNRYTSASFKKTILQFPADKVLLAIRDRQDVIESLDFDDDLQSLLVEALVKIATDQSFQNIDAYALLNVFERKLKAASFSQLNSLIKLLSDHKVSQEKANFLLLEIVGRCSHTIADTTDVYVLLMKLPRQIHDEFFRMLMARFWEVPDDEMRLPDYVSQNINKFDEDSTIDLLRELSGLSFAGMLTMAAFASPAFTRHENVISLLEILVIGICTKMDFCQRERILNNSNNSTLFQLRGPGGEALMQQRLLEEYDDALSRFMKNFGRLLTKNVSLNDLLQVITDINQCTDPLFTPDAKRIALRLLVNNTYAAITDVDEANIVMEKLHENDRYYYMAALESFWQKDLASRRKAFLSGNNHPEATSHGFFHHPECNEYLKRKILFEAGYLAREPEREKSDGSDRQLKRHKI